MATISYGTVVTNSGSIIRFCHYRSYYSYVAMMSYIIAATNIHNYSSPVEKILQPSLVPFIPDDMKNWLMTNANDTC